MLYHGGVTMENVDTFASGPCLRYLADSLEKCHDETTAPDNLPLRYVIPGRGGGGANVGVPNQPASINANNDVRQGGCKKLADVVLVNSAAAIGDSEKGTRVHHHVSIETFSTYQGDLPSLSINNKQNVRARNCMHATTGG